MKIIKPLVISVLLSAVYFILVEILLRDFISAQFHIYINNYLYYVIFAIFLVIFYLYNRQLFTIENARNSLVIGQKNRALIFVTFFSSLIAFLDFLVPWPDKYPRSLIFVLFLYPPVILLIIFPLIVLILSIFAFKKSTFDRPIWSFLFVCFILINLGLLFLRWLYIIMALAYSHSP